MSADSLVSPTDENGNAGNKRTPCPFHGCKRVYTDGSSLQNHIKDHEISAESLPGKILLCSTVGCSGSFPNMQKLMEHMRHHHKPNIYFLCESCRTKLRSYRGLLTHLHTCSKVPRGKPKPAEPTPPPPAAVTPMDSGSTPQTQTPNPGGSPPQLDSAAPPLLGSRFLSNPETSPQRLAEAAPPSQLRNGASEPPPSLNLVGPTAPPAAAAPDPPEAPSQHQTQAKSPGSAPHSPPASSAVWKKSQGLACSRRILWEHTKGRYTCVQCGHSVTNRKEMTQHINTQHSTNRPAEDAGSSASKT